MNDAYSILRFSPRPEQLEHVNIALAFGGQPIRMHWDPEFPKLRCVHPGFSQSLLVDYLETFAMRIRDVAIADLPSAIARLSPQFQATPPCFLDGELTEEVLATLSRVYLRKHRVQSVAETPGWSTLDTAIHRVLVDELAIPDRALLRKARPRQFLRPEVLEELGRDGFRVSRAVSGPEDLVLFDGVNFDIGSTLKKHLTDVDYMFFRMESIKGAIRRHESRRLHLVAMLFGKKNENQPHHAHAVDVLRKRAEYLVTPESVPSELVTITMRAAAEVRLPI